MRVCEPPDGSQTISLAIAFRHDMAGEQPLSRLDDVRWLCEHQGAPASCYPCRATVKGDSMLSLAIVFRDDVAGPMPIDEMDPIDAPH